MKIKEELGGKLKKAVKEKDERLSLVLRTLLATLQNQEIAFGKRPLKDEEIVQLFLKEIKKREEALVLYKKGNREDLAEKEKEEIAIIKSFLPKLPSKKEVEKLVEMAIKETGAKEKKDVGRVIGYALKETQGMVEKGEIARLTLEKLKN